MPRKSGRGLGVEAVFQLVPSRCAGLQCPSPLVGKKGAGVMHQGRLPANEGAKTYTGRGGKEALPGARGNRGVAFPRLASLGLTVVFSSTLAGGDSAPY